MNLKLIFLLFLLPFIVGWNWETHTALVESMYYELNVSFLDLDSLRNGSIAPDRDFHDNRLHHYPPSYEKTKYWLAATKKSLRKGDYKNASYSFGVATHYMGDSFAAPHNVEKEPSYLHAKYEDQASTNYDFVSCERVKEKYNLHSSLQEAVKQGEHWNYWVQTEEVTLPREAAKASYEFILQVGKTTFQGSCTLKKTTILKGFLLEQFSPWKLMLLSLICFGIISLTFSLVK